jgi:signal peptidase I
MDSPIVPPPEAPVAARPSSPPPEPPRSSSSGDSSRPSRRALRGLRDLLSLAGFALALFAARSTLADHYFVPTGSMIPSVEIGDRVLVNKVAYALRVPFSDMIVAQRRGPERGDVVVLRSPENGITLLKRVAATPGDVVAVVDGRLWINGRAIPIAEQSGQWVEELGHAIHPVRLTSGGGRDYGPVRLGADEYLMLGDNRGESHDGRAFGLVEREAILGKALGVWMRDGHPGWHPL